MTVGGLGIRERAGVRASRAALGHLPAGMGQFRVADRVYTRLLAPCPRGTLVRTRLQGGALVELDVSDYVEARVALVRHWQPAVVSFVASRLGRGGTFFDVGAHVGILSLAVSSACAGAQPDIHAFEALPHNAHRMRRNVALNPATRAKVNGVAVGAAAGTVEISAPDPRVPSMGYVSAGGEGPTVAVPMIALDDYAEEQGIDFVDVLKIDVEGYEPHVLEGCERQLSERRVGAVVCELNDDALADAGTGSDALVATFARHGYERHPLPNVGVRRLTRGLLQASFDDAVFLPGA
jgi:FkbM family methyltransferase